MNRDRALRLVGEYAADQWGLITTRQASELGIDRTTLTRLVDIGLLESPARGVYLIPAAAGAASHLPERAAWLRLAPARPAWQRQPLDDDSGVLSHRTAAQIHGLGDLLADRVEFTVPRRRATRDTQVRFHVAQLEGGDVTTVEGLPVTTAERTVVDLLAARVDGGHVGDVLADALRRNQVQLDELAPRVAGYAARYGVRGRDGRQLLDDLLEQAGYTEPQQLHQRQVRDLAELLSSLDRPQLTALQDAAAAAQRLTSPVAEIVAQQQRILEPILERMQISQQMSETVRAALAPMEKSLAAADPAAVQLMSENIDEMNRKITQTVQPALDALGAAYTTRRAEQLKTTEPDRNAEVEDANADRDTVKERDR